MRCLVSMDEKNDPAILRERAYHARSLWLKEFYNHNDFRYNENMIKNFDCHETHKIWEGEVSLRIARDIQQTARRKLRMLHNAKQLNDLRIPPNNRLEALKGNRAGEYSIRINKQWRICFKWQDNDAYHVGIEDYH